MSGINPIRYHRVQWGETLATLAKLYYDDINMAIFIYTHNRVQIQNPNVIYPGQLIAIPHANLTGE
jgi:nucleoid-associated protein YgaU